MTVDVSIRKDESIEEYKLRIYEYKINGYIDYSWQEIADIIFNETLESKDRSTHFRACKKAFKDGLISIHEKEDSIEEQEEQEKEDIKDLINEFRKERFKLSDERTQERAYLRRISREETLKEIATDAAKEIAKTKNLLSPSYNAAERAGYNEAILQLSDWHYGIDIDNPWNTFNPEICKKRINKLLDEVICFCYTFGVNKLHLVNLGDLISGRIHSTIRLESRCDVITQTMMVSEILSEFISTLTAEGINIEYYDCLDNHSRLEPIKADSLELESLARIIPWYLATRLDSNKLFNINYNEFGADIITFPVLNGKYMVAGVHGHKDRPNKVVDNLTLMTKLNYDLILTAHLHHFQIDEKNQVVVISNGSLMGTDTYAKDFRLSARPSQNIILVNEQNVVDYIHRITLD